MRFTQLYLIVTFVLSLIIGYVTYNYIPLFRLGGFDKALDGILLLSSISLGFYGACLSVIASIFNTKLVREIMTDKEYRKDFILISCSSLAIGFIAVINTIVYQVLLKNPKLPEIVFKITNASWVGVLIIYFSLTLIFIFISFAIFFKNQEKEEITSVYEPQHDYSKLDKSRK